MAWRIKNWETFQHFRDRTPPWIKLHRILLDDHDWHKLEPSAAKFLVMLWLLASEDKKKQGWLPPIDDIAFRLRMSEQDVISLAARLSHWLERDDNAVISACHHDNNVLPHPARSQETEAEAETERETEKRSPNGDSINSRFEIWWQEVPKTRRVGKKAVKAEYTRIVQRGEATHDELLIGMRGYRALVDAERTETQYIVHPERWLKKGRWADDNTVRREPTPQEQLQAWARDDGDQGDDSGSGAIDGDYCDVSGQGSDGDGDGLLPRAAGSERRGCEAGDGGAAEQLAEGDRAEAGRLADNRRRVAALAAQAAGATKAPALARGDHAQNQAEHIPCPGDPGVRPVGQAPGLLDAGGAEESGGETGGTPPGAGLVYPRDITPGGLDLTPPTVCERRKERAG